MVEKVRRCLKEGRKGKLPIGRNGGQDRMAGREQSREELRVERN